MIYNLNNFRNTMKKKLITISHIRNYLRNLYVCKVSIKSEFGILCSFFIRRQTFQFLNDKGATQHISHARGTQKVKEPFEEKGNHIAVQKNSVLRSPFYIILLTSIHSIHRFDSLTQLI